MRTTHCVVVLMTAALILRAADGKDSDLASVRSSFENEFQLYLQAREEGFQSGRSDLGPTMAKHLGNIIEMGPQVLPQLIEKATLPPQGEEDPSLTLPLYLLTLKRFESSEWPEGGTIDSRAIVRLYVKWWETARRRTPERFGSLYAEVIALRSQGKGEEVKKQVQRIRDLGIAALPTVIAKISQGDRELVPIMSDLTGKRIDPNASSTECASWWRANTDKWLIPFPNGRPTAKAGSDRSATGGDMVQLDASASTDPDGDELSYNWSQVSGPSITLSDATSPKPSFKAPTVEQPTVLVFQLVVDDAGDVTKAVPTPNSRSEPTTVRITVSPKK